MTDEEFRKAVEDLVSRVQWHAKRAEKEAAAYPKRLVGLDEMLRAHEAAQKAAIGEQRRQAQQGQYRHPCDCAERNKTAQDGTRYWCSRCADVRSHREAQR